MFRPDADCDMANRGIATAYARQSHEQNASKTFCAIDPAAPGRVLGFYTVMPSAIAYHNVPAPLTKGLAPHEVAGFRLATDVAVGGWGLGGQLLVAAALRCLRVAADADGMLLIIDAKNERAAQWYASYGAETLPNIPLTLVIPLASFVAELKAKGQL
ncbi:hypothetical protein [Rhizorhapis sp. SPR117]|nr:GNAT family N-acetyltransferase [Rhizorhapis sp. SPR117]